MAFAKTGSCQGKHRPISKTVTAMDSGSRITGGGSGYDALLAHAGGVLYGTELGSVTLKRIGFFCFPIKHSTHTLPPCGHGSAVNHVFEWFMCDVCVCVCVCVCCVCLSFSLFLSVCSQHSASQHTLRDCTKCRGILSMRALQALSRTESDEASSRSCCAQLTVV
jgi:hypothetical protein